ncbi:uncharacterized protein LOC107868977 [Capsicum annuum]|uniref:uncharacterized protein LOC107868977 n=1 Tax=Capsicum annuum TaxID=4072 RepID=UPI0007BF3C09|nr:uncharacterized protein LOC107868977 [Capsicum annuum]
MSSYYHLDKANVVVDALRRFSTGSLAHVDAEKRGLAKAIHRLSNLGVCLLNFEDRGIVRRIGNVANEVDLPASLASIHPVFLESMLKKCVGDPSLIVPVKDISVLDSLSYEEVSMELLNNQVYRLRTKDVALVKVLWRNQKAV